MRNLLVTALLVLPLAAGACKKNDSEATVEKMVSLMEDLGNVVDKSGDDCGKMADGVEAVVKKYDLQALKASAEKIKGDKAESERLMKKYGDRMQKVMPKMMGMMKCADDPKMKAVNDKLRGVM
jgi:hypothetical protein